MSSFLNNFRSSFEKSGMTQAELSRVSLIPRSNIHDYLTGKYEPKQKRLVILAKAVDVDPVWLAGNKIERIDIENSSNLFLDKRLITENEVKQIVNYLRLIRLMEKN